MRQILLFGSMVAPEEVAAIPEASEAANRFQWGLIQGLREAGVGSISALTAYPILTLPRPRRVVVPAHRWVVEGVEIVAPGFLNLPPVKPVWVHRVLTRAGLRATQGAEAVLSYNAAPGPGSAAAATARALGVPFICIVADHSVEGGSNPIRRTQWRWSGRILQEADGVIALSGHTVADLGLQAPWIKLDGGVADDWDVLPATVPQDKTVVYAGTPAEVSGTRLLLEAFALIQDPDMRLLFLGRGGIEEEVRAAAAGDSRISVGGFLPRSEMKRMLASATVLVNPRLSDREENRYNFPSKMLDYLASGRPVVTTLAGDLDAVYRTVAIPLEEETPAALARLLEDVCSASEEHRATVGARGRAFVLSERRWSDQGARALSFIQELTHPSVT